MAGKDGSEQRALGPWSGPGGTHTWEQTALRVTGTGVANQTPWRSEEDARTRSTDTRLWMAESGRGAPARTARLHPRGFGNRRPQQQGAEVL